MNHWTQLTLTPRATPLVGWNTVDVRDPDIETTPKKKMRLWKALTVGIAGVVALWVVVARRRQGLSLLHPIHLSGFRCGQSVPFLNRRFLTDTESPARIVSNSGRALRISRD